MLDQTDKALLRACLNDLYRSREDFTHAFYDRLFEAVPEVTPLFVHDRQKQERMLFAVAAASVNALTAGRDISDELVAFGRMHLHVGIDETHFPVFGRVFAQTMWAFLPGCDRAAVARAWDHAWGEITAWIYAGMEAERQDIAIDKRVFFPRPRDPAPSERAPERAQA